MLSSRFFWKLVVASAGLNLVAAVVFGLILSNWLEDQVIEQVDRRLHEAAYLVRGEISDQWQPEPNETLQTRLRRFSSGSDTRLTLIALDGTVLADSERATLAEVRAMDNHRDRPEIVQARTHGVGRSTRNSTTLAAPQRYFALRVEADGKPVGFVRCALPVASIQAQTATMRRWIWSLVALVCACVLGVSVWMVGRIIRPVTSLTEAAAAIAEGDYQRRVYVSNRDELGVLARTFNRMSEELGMRVRQLNQTGDRQSTVLGGMIEGVIAVDDRQRVVLANSAAGRLFAFRPPIVEGRPLMEVVRNHALHEAVRKCLATSQPQRIEAKSSLPHPGSSNQHVDIHVQPLPGEPCPGAVLVMHDTTELRRLESLRRDFVANVSHELKTPLSSIKAYAETLRNGAVHDPETMQKFLGRIEEQTDRLNHLIVDMLMIARIESEQQVFEIASVDLPAVVAACIEDHRTTAESKRISLCIELDQSPCRVRADREALREILDNLVDNAIKYTPDGGQVSVGWTSDAARSEERGASVEPQAHSPQPASVQFWVRDTGIGIKPKDQQRVFERFYRVDKARSRELGGTGLGLAIVKHLAQAFGGKVSVESEPGKGSTFTVELPAG